MYKLVTAAAKQLEQTPETIVCASLEKLSFSRDARSDAFSIEMGAVVLEQQISFRAKNANLKRKRATTDSDIDLGFGFSCAAANMVPAKKSAKKLKKLPESDSGDESVAMEARDAEHVSDLESSSSSSAASPASGSANTIQDSDETYFSMCLEIFDIIQWFRYKNNFLV